VYTQSTTGCWRCRTRCRYAFVRVFTYTSIYKHICMNTRRCMKTCTHMYEYT